MKNGGSWCGETHVQKCVYFLQQLLKVPMEFNCIMYKHGPYSFDLNDELAFFKGSEFLELHPRRPYMALLFLFIEAVGRIIFRIVIQLLICRLSPVILNRW